LYSYLKVPGGGGKIPKKMIGDKFMQQHVGSCEKDQLLRGRQSGSDVVEGSEKRRTRLKARRKGRANILSGEPVSGGFG